MDPLASQNSKNNQWHAFITNEKAKATLLDIAQTHHDCQMEVITGNLDKAIEHVANRDIRYLLIDISGEDDPIPKIKELAEHCHDEIYVIALGKTDNVSFYRKLQLIGIDDYLVLPIEEKALFDAMQTVGVTTTKSKAHQRQNIIVAGARSGVGASTIAVNLAHVFSENRQYKTCLIDWDYHFGSALLSFDLASNMDLVEAIGNVDRLDTSLLENLSKNASENLSVLGALCPLDMPITVQPNDVMKITTLLNEINDITLHDIPHSSELLYQLLNDDTTAVIIISDLSINAIRDTQRILEFCKKQAPHSDIIMVLMNDKSLSGEQITIKQFGLKVERNPDHIIENDKNIIVGALNIGEPLAKTDPNHPMIVTLRKITQSILKIKTQEKKKSILKRWLHI